MIILYKGARGRGKTLTMVKDAFRMHLSGYSVFSNMSLKFGSRVSPDEVLSLNRESALKHCVLVLDELQLFFDSRNFTKPQNKDFSNFIQQIRKRDIHILYTTQYVNLVDLRIRQQTDIVAFPKFDIIRGFCLVDYYDITKLEDDISISDIKPVSACFNAVPYFALYDTYEMLK